MTGAPNEDDLPAHFAFTAVPPPISRMLSDELDRLEPVAPRRPRRRFVMLVVATAVVVATLLAVLGTRADLWELPAGWMPLVAIGWTVGLIGAGWFALVPPTGVVMPRWRTASAVVAVVGCAFVVLGLVVHPSGPSSAYFGWEKFLRGHGCLELGLATASIPVVVGAWFVRGTAPVGTRWIGAAIGAAGGCAGGLILHFYCRIADGPHIGLIHGGVVACAAGIAAVVVPRLANKPIRIT